MNQPMFLTNPIDFIHRIKIENLEDLANACRTCATVTESVIPIFDGEGLQNSLADKIYQHLSIQVNEYDELPRALCRHCADTLVAWHRMVQCCMRADRELRTRLRQLRSLSPSPSAPPTSPPLSPITTSHLDEQLKVESTGQRLDDNQPDWRDKPTTATELFNDLYQALVELKRHVHEDHDARAERCRYPDLTDDSDTALSAEEVAANQPNSYDDLSPYRMRRENADAEVSAARHEADGRIYYGCGNCGKRLASRHTYLAHRRIHTGERPCVCHVCGKQFRAAAGLRRHLVETHERRRRRACALCHKSFANSQNLKQHARTHTGERPYVCMHCGKRFTQSGSLHVHARIHSTLAPYRCPECGAQFRLRAGLARHRLRHTGERPHACNACPKTFRQRHELMAHAAAHSDARPHACTCCGAAFRQRRALRLHYKRAHPHQITTN